MGKILINVRILQDPFLIMVFFIRVNHEAQDISLHIYSWGPSKNHVGSVKRPFTTVSFPLRQGGLVIKQKVVSLRAKSSSSI